MRMHYQLEDLGEGVRGKHYTENVPATLKRSVATGEEQRAYQHRKAIKRRTEQQSRLKATN